VEQGGHILATMRSFFADENMKIRAAAQPYGMTDVFGMTYDEFTIPQGETRLSGLPGQVEDWMELLRPTTAKVLASYDGPGFGGTAAITENAFGKGTAVYVGCYAPQIMEPLLRSVLEARGIEPPSVSWPVVVKSGINDFDKKVTYLMNYSSQPVTVPAPDGVELLTGNPCGGELTLEPWGVVIVEESDYAAPTSGEQS